MTLASLLKRKGIKFSVGVYPWPDQLVFDSVNSLQVRLWKDWCIQNGCYRFINHFPDFFERTSAGSWPTELFLDDDVHFNADGNRLMASKLIDAFAN